MNPTNSNIFYSKRILRYPENVDQISSYNFLFRKMYSLQKYKFPIQVCNFYTKDENLTYRQTADFYAFVQHLRTRII